MTKTFCDICEKEIKPIEHSSSIELKPDSASRDGHTLFKVCCKDCCKAVQNFIENKLAKPFSETPVEG